jgi:transposase
VRKDLSSQIKQALQLSALAPQERKSKTQTQTFPRWTLKRFVHWMKQKWKIDCCRETVRKTIKQMGFSWKKAKKLLNKGNTAKRAEFIQQITRLVEDALHQRRLIIYIDEAHIHLDTDEGYGWSIRGERFWVSSSSPGRQKVSFYGVYLYNQAQTRIFPYDKAEKINTIDVLKQLRVEFPEQQITVVWDGAPYHRAKLVQEAASAMDIHLLPLPGYSPDFMPVEHLWQWLREDLTYHICYDSQQELIDAVSVFQSQINANPIAISDRLWVKKHLEPDEEQLRFSK